MLAVVGALVAGVLTTLAPCVLPLLPVIVGGSVQDADPAARRPRVPRAVVVTASLGLSVALFTLLLRASTALLGVPTEVWSAVSGLVLVLLGLVMALPDVWERIAA